METPQPTNEARENDMLRQALVKVNAKYEKLLVENEQLLQKASQRPKDLVREIETLKKENEELEARIDRLED